MSATVRLPRLNMLAVDLAASLFRLTIGDVSIGAGDAEPTYEFEVVDVDRFGEKLRAFSKKANEILRSENLREFLGWSTRSDAPRKCSQYARDRQHIQELAAYAAERPIEVLRHLSTVKENKENIISDKVKGNCLIIKWGYGISDDDFIKLPPPLLESVEFMEGIRAWPAEQFDAEETREKRRKKTIVRSGLRRYVRPTCLVLGALALGAAATYVTEGWRGKTHVIRFLIPLSFVEYSIHTADIIGGLTRMLGELGICEPPEPLTRLLVMSLVGKPAVFRLVDVAYTGGKEVDRDNSKELVIDMKAFGGRRSLKILRVLSRHREALYGLARQWCNCERRGWPREREGKEKECDDVARAGTIAAKVYFYADTGDLERAYEALSSLLRLSRDIAGGVERVVGGLVW
ncbi:MAG: hypothetical protein LM577_08250 [Thermoproteaceae archaeon]|nr:hypothetical protein [Thermoproteaceae archaeon]